MMAGALLLFVGPVGAAGAGVADAFSPGGSSETATGDDSGRGLLGNFWTKMR